MSVKNTQTAGIVKEFMFLTDITQIQVVKAMIIQMLQSLEMAQISLAAQATIQLTTVEQIHRLTAARVTILFGTTAQRSR